VFFLILRAYSKLIRFDSYVAQDRFDGLYETVRGYPLKRRSERQRNSVQEICKAVDVACIWYWKEVLCLQRSAATVCLLRSYGVRAQLAIGAQPLPFKAHAWVEIDGCVVNDKSYVSEIYSVLDRC
jgi:hypothetical protein